MEVAVNNIDITKVLEPDSYFVHKDLRLSLLQRLLSVYKNQVKQILAICKVSDNPCVLLVVPNHFVKNDTSVLLGLA